MPSPRKFEFTSATGGAAFTVRIATRAEQADVLGLMDDGALGVALVASRLDEAANEELVGLLAWRLAVLPEHVAIIGGHAAAEKLVSIEGLTPADVEVRLGLSGIH